MGNLQLLLPEVLLAVSSLALLLADLWVAPERGKGLYHVGIVCAALTLGALGVCYGAPLRLQGIGTLWVVDPMSLFFKILVLGSAVLALLFALDYESAHLPKRHLGSFAALLLLSALGMMLLVSATDLLLIFLSLELISICSFILAGFERSSLKSNEGAVKYFLIGALSSAIMAYGISLYYGAAGTTSLQGYAAPSSVLSWLAALFLTAGFGFKASIAPFHLWVPDAYEGAPAPVTAFLSVAPKVAALAAMLRVFGRLLPDPADQSALFAALAVLTMTVGNLTALFQTNVKRMLAYSSIAQAGYMLMGFAACSPLGRDGVLLYCLAYLFMNMGAFAVAIMVGNDSSYELEAYDGLATRSFAVALLMTFFLLSLAGIPPLAGFIAKFYVFAAVMETRHYWLAAVAALNSVVSVFYYLRIAYHMFFMPAKTQARFRPGFYLASGLAVAALGVLLIGIYPDPFILTVRVSSQIFPTISQQTPGASGISP